MADPAGCALPVVWYARLPYRGPGQMWPATSASHACSLHGAHVPGGVGWGGVVLFGGRGGWCVRVCVGV